MQGCTLLKRVTVVAAFSATLLCPPVASVAIETPSWSRAQRDLSAVLMEQGADIAEMAMRASEATPQNDQEAMFKLGLLMRAGMSGEAVVALHELKALCPQLDGYVASRIYYTACDTFQAYEVARTTLEVFADSVAEVSLDI